jgi:pathogenesis-related protein 1
MRFGSSGCRMYRFVAWLPLILLLYAPAAKSRTSKARPRIDPVRAIAGEMLNVHNTIRSKVNLPPLQWSGELAAYSQKWADTLIARNITDHNPKSPYGENIFVTGPGSTPLKVVQEWASESLDYSYRTNVCAGDDCGHYTQIVWRSSQKVGCGVARNPRREAWVCSYDPPGNYRNEWPY